MMKIFGINTGSQNVLDKRGCPLSPELSNFMQCIFCNSIVLICTTANNPYTLLARTK